MRRFAAILLTLALVLALTAPACADVLWEPSGNLFYTLHQNDCTYHGRGYYANGEKGFVTLWDAPNGSRVMEQFENGFALHVYWLYDDWGCVSVRDGGGWIEGWVPMAELSLIYDNISFQEEYGDRIRAYNGEFAAYDGDAEGVNFFAYPGAPEIHTSWDFSEWKEILENLTGSDGRKSYISSIFVDENGLTWGYVGYMYGRMNAWFCLDDPDGTDFPLREVSGQELIPGKTPALSDLPARAFVPYILVAAVAGATGALLILLRKKKSAKS